MAQPTIVSALSGAQSNDCDSKLYLIVIQQPVRRWERPWRHQRTITLFATSPEEVKLRLQLESLLLLGEQCLQVVQADRGGAR